MGMSISMLSDAVEANHCAMCQMKDDTAAILVLNSFLNKSSTSNSLVPGCYHIHIQTKFFFIAGLRNLVDWNKSCFSIPESQYFFPWKRHIILLSRKLLMKLLFLMMKITLTNCNSKVELWSCQGACELKAFPQPAEEENQSLSLSVNSVTETDVQQTRYQSVAGSCGTSFLSSCKRLSTPSPSLCCKTSAILVTSRLLAAKVCSLLLSVAVEGYCWQLFSTLLQPLLHHLPFIICNSEHIIKFSIHFGRLRITRVSMAS